MQTVPGAMFGFWQETMNVSKSEVERQHSCVPQRPEEPTMHETWRTVEA